MQSAIIIRAHLPAALERLRRRSVADATRGVPAHVTLLYPFVQPSELGTAVRSRVAAIARAETAFDYRLRGPGRWPDTAYAAVEPASPFLRLHRAFARAFPDYPIYGRPGFELVPHVTVAEGAAATDPATLRHPAWGELPVAARAAALEVIASDARDRWHLVWRIPLGTG